jgi:hypothetical protein
MKKCSDLQKCYYTSLAIEWWEEFGVKTFSSCRTIATNAVAEYLANLSGETIFGKGE